jgi:formylglycine-generating enzyme required for sulfatase activity
MIQEVAMRRISIGLSAVFLFLALAFAAPKPVPGQPSSTSQPQAFPEPTYQDPVTGIEFVLVKGGCYRMGDTSGDGESDQRPVHEVCVDDFYLGRTEVTVGQFEKFVSATRYQTEAEREGLAFALTYRGWAKVADRNWRNPGFPQTDRHPVVCVSWNDARAFLDWLSKKTGKAVRLPTEAEWEYAARCGGKNYKYGQADEGPSGNIADEALWRAKGVTVWWKGYDDGFVYTAPVKSFSPNEVGLYDMIGNVWEWCQDWYGNDYYAGSPKDNPSGPGSGASRVVRGGSWYSEPGFVPVAFRFGVSPSERMDGLGFRVALPLQ